MITRVSAALNMTDLSSVDPAIVLQSVKESPPVIEVTAGNRAGLDGQYIQRISKKTRDVTISFGILIPKTDPFNRAAVLQRVCAWAAAGGDLTVSYRDRQKLRVVCVELPEVAGVDQWTDVYSITFRAYAVPYWQSMDRESANLSATSSGSGTLTVKESGGGKLSFNAYNSSGSTCDTVTVTANGKSIAFSDLGLANGETLVVDYDDRDIQRLRIANSGTYRSVLAKRTAASADDIPLTFGANAFAVSAGKALAWELYTYGRWE